MWSLMLALAAKLPAMKKSRQQSDVLVLWMCMFKRFFIMLAMLRMASKAPRDAYEEIRELVR